MPPADKASSSKASSSKAPPPSRASVKPSRGVPRAKSGCYTCRIRRKKCDEQPDEHGRCATCVRLRLECLGFGAKRPEWLRDNRNVVEVREKIKFFLASQGMVKGFSGAPRQGFTFQEPQYFADSSGSTPQVEESPPRSPKRRSTTPYRDPVQETNFKPMSFGRGTQHLLNQEMIPPLRSAYYLRPVDDSQDREWDESVSDQTSEMSSEDRKIEELTTRIESLFMDKKEYIKLLSCRGLSARKLLDVFQRLLDVMTDPAPSFHKNLIVVTQELAYRSGLHPMYYDLADVTGSDTPECSGAFADTYQGKFRGRAVCIKTFRLQGDAQLEQFLKIISKEALLWGQLRHPNVLPFYGIYYFKTRISFVTPWMDNGDIGGYLENNDSNRVLLSFDIARGLQFLHDNGVIHGDLKGANILVNELGRACLGDFGVFSVNREVLAWASSSSSIVEGTVRWRSPELLDPQEGQDICATEASDIYAWACVAYEIFAGQVPFAHLTRDAPIVAKVTSGERPARPLDTSPSWSAWGLTEVIWELMQACWNANPSKRPSVGVVIEVLKTSLPLNIELDARYSSVSPGEFREMTRRGVEEIDMSVEAFDRLLVPV